MLLCTSKQGRLSVQPVTTPYNALISTPRQEADLPNCLGIFTEENPKNIFLLQSMVLNWSLGHPSNSANLLFGTAFSWYRITYFLHGNVSRRKAAFFEKTAVCFTRCYSSESWPKLNIYLGKSLWHLFTKFDCSIQMRLYYIFSDSPVLDFQDLQNLWIYMLVSLPVVWGELNHQSPSKHWM